MPAYAGAAMTSSLVERCSEVFEPQIFVNHYGSTEIYTFSIHRDQRRKPGCAGRAALNARLRLGEDDEVECHLGRSLRQGVELGLHRLAVVTHAVGPTHGTSTVNVGRLTRQHQRLIVPLPRLST